MLLIVIIKDNDLGASKKIECQNSTMMTMNDIKNSHPGSIWEYGILSKLVILDASKGIEFKTFFNHDED